MNDFTLPNLPQTNTRISRDNLGGCQFPFPSPVASLILSRIKFQSQLKCPVFQEALLDTAKQNGTLSGPHEIFPHIYTDILP